MRPTHKKELREALGIKPPTILSDDPKTDLINSGTTFNSISAFGEHQNQNSTSSFEKTDNITMKEIQ